jgi:YhcH/YjgK/YiaL family protein
MGAAVDCGMALFGSIATVRAQAFPAEAFAAAFAYLEELFRPGSATAERLRTMPAGETRRVELAGGAFALEQAYLSKRRENGFFESHRNYIDVQVVFEGDEWMEVADLSRTSAKEHYQPERDLIVYRDGTAATRLHLGAGEAAVFHPSDVHLPGLCGAAPALVRKTVIKVPVAGTRGGEGG